jgi:hypothetical protein
VLNLKFYQISFETKEPSQSAKGVKLTLFEKIIVRISIDTKNIQHQKMKLELVKPIVRLLFLFVYYILYLKIQSKKDRRL